MNERTIIVKQQRPFWKKYKKKIKYGVVAGGTLLAIMTYKNRNTIASWFRHFSRETVNESTLISVPIMQSDVAEGKSIQHVYVPSYVRNLPLGQKASISKLEQAAKEGYKLYENQTWVREYTYEKNIV